MSQESQKKEKKRTVAKILLLIAILLFGIWLMATSRMLFIHMTNISSKNEVEDSNTTKNSDVTKSLQNESINISNEKKEMNNRNDNEDGEEIEPLMENLIKDKELTTKNIDAIFENMKSPKDISAIHSTFGKDVVYIYHSHSRESFLPYLKNAEKPEEAYHSKANITLVGKMLGRALQHRGMGAKVDTTDVVQVLDSKDLDYGSSYDISRKLIQAAKSENNKLEYFIDIHRDSLRKDQTTADINGVNFANILFVVGTGHDNYEKNLQFSNDLHTLLNTRFPNLSKGVIEKSISEGNGIYNQDLSSHSIIIEIGGVDNTVEELHRSTEALAEVLSDYYWHK